MQNTHRRIVRSAWDRNTSYSGLASELDIIGFDINLASVDKLENGLRVFEEDNDGTPKATFEFDIITGYFNTFEWILMPEEG